MIRGWFRCFWHYLWNITHEQVTVKDNGNLLMIACDCGKIFWERE